MLKQIALLVVALHFAAAWPLYGVEEQGAPVPSAISVVSGSKTSGSRFLKLTELTILTVIPEAPIDLEDGRLLPLAAYLQRCGSAAPGLTLSDQLTDTHVLPISGKRCAVVRVQSLYVRTADIAVIDGRAASLYAFPPTPAPSADGKGAGLLPLPEAIGVSLAAGSARLFCGVRTGRIVDPNAVKAVTLEDLRAVAAKTRTPSPEDVLSLIQDP